MMKKGMMMTRMMALLVLLLLSGLTYSQQVLVPYRVKDKFGLSDENGKLVLAAKYDIIEYLQPGYLKFAILRTYKDSFTTNYGQKVFGDREDNLYGLIKGSKVLIESKQYRHFFVRNGFIIGSENEYRPEKCMLYDLNGKSLLTEEAAAIYIDDSRDIGNLAKADKNVVLLTIMNKLERRSYLTSIAVYDIKKQVIKQWLVKNARDFKVDRTQQGANYVFCSFTDESGYHEKLLQYTSTGFTVVDAESKKQPDKSKQGYAGADEVMQSMDEVIGVPEVEESRQEPTMTEKEEEERGYVYYQFQRDTLFYVRAKGRSPVQLATGTSLIFAANKSTSQQGPLLFKQQGRFGLISKGVAGNTMYDSLIYFGHMFIAGKKTDGSYKFGIIDKTGKELVPLIYDSIPGNLQEFVFGDEDPRNRKTRSFVLKNKGRYDNYMNKAYYKQEAMSILVYKNGKCGLISAGNEIIVPIEYDMLAENAMSFGEPKKEAFIITKKDGKYGTVQLSYNYGTKTSNLMTKLAPVLPYIPAFYIDNYYDKKGLRLYGLYDEQTRFVGYASDGGKVYFE